MIQTYNTGKVFLEFKSQEDGSVSVEIWSDPSWSESFRKPTTKLEWKEVARNLAEAIFDMRNADDGITSVDELLAREETRFVHA